MGDAKYLDDPTVLPEHALWRRIPPWHLVPDENIGYIRISSAAFEDDEDGDPMSVTLGDDHIASGMKPDSLLGGLEGFGMVAVKARLAREKRLGIQRCPVAEDPHHAKVFGPKPQSVRKALARGATWVIVPPGETLLGLDRLPPHWQARETVETAHRLLTPPGT